ncbi:amino acid aminotransferase [Asticcacaulis sp. YBE204]|uniref:amino acid aminotransferase n=1 Tax=Asticcacaulis sp. YBE204 TaxID=1282363 RepID=UPI0003C3DE14|nr:amino acid aminotransferase [Asticcacaulis sp. YBE204]ESQ81344.1 hypothetical protein AEYBE204_03100 [Asticcacaulis sp. YBE204]
MDDHKVIQTGWSRLPSSAPDALLGLIAQFRADPRPHRIDLGVGVYKDESGHTPVFDAVKAAEQRLIETQTSKSYLGAEGDTVFVERLIPVIFGANSDRQRLTGLQTPGGTGALRLGADLLRLSRQGPARIHVGVPGWVNHTPLFQAAGLEIVEHSYVSSTGTLAFDRVLAALHQARRGDAVLIQASGHNPTGLDFSPAQWRQLADTLSHNGLIPFLDMAYQGLSQGLDADAQGARLIFDACPDALLAYSCDKNFGLYRDRVGALFVQSARRSDLPAIAATLTGLARVSWSMPPDHGAAVVRLILDTPALTAQWQAELTQMRERINGLREVLAEAHPFLRIVAHQSGMFSFLPLTPAQIATLREDFAIYMAGSGRISLCGLNAGNMAHFVSAIASVTARE